MRQLYYPTTQQQYFDGATNQDILEESHNLFENAASTVNSLFRGLFFIVLLGISGVGLFLFSWLMVLDENDL